jgi:hypothetical protein
MKKRSISASSHSERGRRNITSSFRDVKSPKMIAARYSGFRKPEGHRGCAIADVICSPGYPKAKYLGYAMAKLIAKWNADTM